MPVCRRGHAGISFRLGKARPCVYGRNISTTWNKSRPRSLLMSTEK
jgi:hypothetical protein